MILQYLGYSAVADTFILQDEIKYRVSDYRLPG
jgi:hypothetical protein